MTIALGEGFKMTVMAELLANAGLAWVILSAVPQVLIEHGIIRPVRGQNER